MSNYTPDPTEFDRAVALAERVKSAGLENDVMIPITKQQQKEIVQYWFHYFSKGVKQRGGAVMNLSTLSIVLCGVQLFVPGGDDE